MANEIKNRQHAIGLFAPVPVVPFTTPIVSRVGIDSFTRNGPGNYTVVLQQAAPFATHAVEAAMGANVIGTIGGQLAPDGGSVLVTAFDLVGQPFDPPQFSLIVDTIRDGEGVGPAAALPVVPELTAPPGTTIFVNSRTVSSLQNGSELFPFKTIGQAVDALPPAATTGAQRRLVHRDIFIMDDGTFDEDIDIVITGRSVRIVSLGAWRLGLFDAVGWNQSGTRRNVTVRGSTDLVDGIQSYFSICNTIELGLRYFTFGTKASAPRISGKVSFPLESPGAGGPATIGQLLVHLEAEIQGTTGNATGISIESLQPEATPARVFMAIDKSFIAGAIVLDPSTGDIFAIEGTKLRADLTAASARYVRLCECVGDWAVTSAGLLTPLRGFIDCTFEGQWDGVAGTAMEIDAPTLARMLESGATVINGFRKFLGSAAVPVFAGGALAPAVGQHLEANGTASTGSAGALGPATQESVGVAALLTELVWNSTTADATTVLKILVNGAVVATVTLDGAAGSIDLAAMAVGPVQPVVAAGDTVAVEYDAGAAPGAMTARVLAH